MKLRLLAEAEAESQAAANAYSEQREGLSRRARETAFELLDVSKNR